MFNLGPEGGRLFCYPGTDKYSIWDHLSGRQGLTKFGELMFVSDESFKCPLYSRVGIRFTGTDLQHIAVYSWYIDRLIDIFLYSLICL